MDGGGLPSYLSGRAPDYAVAHRANSAQLWHIQWNWLPPPPAVVRGRDIATSALHFTGALSNESSTWSDEARYVTKPRPDIDIASS